MSMNPNIFARAPRNKGASSGSLLSLQALGTPTPPRDENSGPVLNEANREESGAGEREGQK